MTNNIFFNGNDGVFPECKFKVWKDASRKNDGVEKDAAPRKIFNEKSFTRILKNSFFKIFLVLNCERLLAVQSHGERSRLKMLQLLGHQTFRFYIKWTDLKGKLS